MSAVKNLIAERPTDWLEHLEAHYKIHVVRDGDLVSLKYNQIESPMTEPVVQECRGMVVHAPSGTVMAWPYNKFWNHGESRADTIDWSTARVQDKLDGSLMILHWDNFRNAWSVASSGHPTAGGSFGTSTTETFRDAFWRIWGELGYALPVRKDVTYMLELCAQENRIVVRHDKPRLVLHGARKLHTGQEVSQQELEAYSIAYGWELVQSFPISTVDACLAAAEALDPISNEGFVVVDANFHRVKIKSPRYVVLHHLKGEFTPRRAIELWQTGESGELLTHFPEMSAQVLPIGEKLDAIASRALADTEDAMSRSTDRKTYAILVKDKPWAALCFRLLVEQEKSDDTARGLLKKQTLASLERLLEAVP